MIDIEEGHMHPEPIHVLSTSKMFRMNPAFKTRLSPLSWKQDKRLRIGNRLTPDLFYFKRHISTTIEGSDQLEQNLARYMAQIVTSDSTPLIAAVANTQI